MHHKQNCDGRLDKMYGEGSITEKQLELEANEAGYLVREFEDSRSSIDEQQAPKKEKFSKVSKNYGLADTRGIAKGNGQFKRMTKIGVYRYPTDNAPDWNKDPNKWNLKDVLEARKDIWNDNWKLNTGRERTDSITNKQS